MDAQQLKPSKKNLLHWWNKLPGIQYVVIIASGVLIGVAILKIFGSCLGCEYQKLPQTFQIPLVFTVLAGLSIAIIIALIRKETALYKILFLGLGLLLTLFFYLLWISTSEGGNYARPQCSPTPTATATPTPYVCPYQGKTDHETIVNLIQAEAEASNIKSMAIMQTIFDPNAKFYDYAASNPPKLWVGPIARYGNDLFLTTDFKNLEHFDILPVGPGIAENMAWYTSGSKGLYRINGGAWQELSNGSLISTTPSAAKFGSEHWTLAKNSAGCWVIMQMEFNAGHIQFPK